MSASGEEERDHEARFLALISGLSSTVMQHLGKVMNPMTGKIERDLQAAREVIDILRMLREKTRGNLTDREERTLNALLSSVQLNYLDEVKAEAEKPKEQPERKPAEEEKAEAPREETAPPAGEEKPAEVKQGVATAAAAGTEPESGKTAAAETEPPEKKAAKPKKAKRGSRGSTED